MYLDWEVYISCRGWEVKFSIFLSGIVSYSQVTTCIYYTARNLVLCFEQAGCSPNSVIFFEIVQSSKQSTIFIFLIYLPKKKSKHNTHFKYQCTSKTI